MTAVDLHERLVAVLRADPTLMQVMRTVRDLDPPDWMIFSGAVYQSVWNHLTGREPGYGIKDFDVGYFDPDISWDAEDAVIRRVAAAFDEPLRSRVEVRNQARVHLWFEDRFGEPYMPVARTAEALERFVAPAFSTGVRLEADDSLTVVSPAGLQDMFDMVIRPNPDRPLARDWDRVVESARARWPEVQVIGP